MKPISVSKLIQAVSQSELIITPKLTRWLLTNDQWPPPKWVADRIYEQFQQAPRVGAGRFSPSASGRCERLQMLNFLGLEQSGTISTQLAQIFANGTWTHLRWQSLLLQSGLATDIEVQLDWKNMFSSGKMDAIGEVGDDHPRPEWRGLAYGIEIKSANSNSFRNTKVAGPEQYKPQSARYALMGGFELYVILQESKDNQEWFEWVYQPTQEELAIQQDELEYLNKMRRKERLPDRLDVCAGLTGEVFRNCPHGKLVGACAKLGKTFPTPGEIANLRR